MIGPIRKRRRFTGQCGQLALEEIAERLAKGVNIFAIAVDKIHRHIEHVFHVAFEPEIFVEHERQHTRAGIVQMTPNAGAPAFVAIWFAIKERRVGKQRSRHGLQRNRDAHFLDHVGFGRKIEVHLHGAGPAHHHFARRTDLVHIGIHQLIAALRHQWHFVMRPSGGSA